MSMEAATAEVALRVGVRDVVAAGRYIRVVIRCLSTRSPMLLKAELVEQVRASVDSDVRVVRRGLTRGWARSSSGRNKIGEERGAVSCEYELPYNLNLSRQHRHDFPL